MDHVQQARRAGSVTVALAAWSSLALMAAACSSSKLDEQRRDRRRRQRRRRTPTSPWPIRDRPKSGGTLKVGLNAETNGWSPSQSQWAGSAYIVAGAIFDYLAEYDTDGVAKPYLAESITSERRLHRVDDQDPPRRDLPER